MRVCMRGFLCVCVCVCACVRVYVYACRPYFIVIHHYIDPTNINSTCSFSIREDSETKNNLEYI